MRAQSKLYVHRHFNFPHISSSSTVFLKYPAYDVLCDRIEEYVRTDPTTFEFLVHTTDLLAIMFECNRDYSRHNKLLFTYKQKGLWHLCEWLLHYNKERLFQTEYRDVILNMIRIMASLNDVVSPEQSVNEEQKGLVPDTYYADMASFVSSRWLDQNVQVATDALYCIKRYIRSYCSRGLHKSVSAVIALLEVAVLYDQSDNEERNNVCLNAIDVLRTLALVNSQHTTVDVVNSILIKCLTYNVYLELAKETHDSKSFADFVRKQVRHPLIIWNDAMREELRKLISQLRDKQEIEMLKQVDSFVYSIEEIVLPVRDLSVSNSVIQQVYIGAFNECWMRGKPKSLASFLQEMSSSTQITDVIFVQSLFQSLNEDLQELVKSEQHDGKICDKISLKTNSLRLIFSATPSSKNYDQSLLFFVVENRSYMSVLVHLFHHTLDNMLHYPGKEEDSRESVLSNLLSIFYLIAQHYLYVMERMEGEEIDEEDEGAETVKTIQLYMGMFVTLMHKLIQYMVGRPNGKMDLLTLSMQLLSELIVQGGANVQNTVLQYMYTSGLTLTILYIMTGTPLTEGTAQSKRSLRLQAARLLGGCCPALINASSPSETMLLDLLLPKFQEHLRAAYESPDLLLYFYDENHDSPVLIWNDDTRRELTDFLTRIVQPIRTYFFPQQGIVHINYSLPQDVLSTYQQQTIAKEIKIGSIFIRCFNENPTHKIWSGTVPMRKHPMNLDPTTPTISPMHFVQQLLTFLFTYTKQKDADKQVEAELWKAVNNLLKFHDLFANEDQVEEQNLQSIVFNRALFPMLLARIINASQQCKVASPSPPTQQPDAVIIDKAPEAENVEMEILDECLSSMFILSQKGTKLLVDYLLAVDERSGDSCIRSFLHVMEKCHDNAQRVNLVLQLITNLVVSDGRFITMEIVLYSIKHLIESTVQENQEKCAELLIKVRF
jgi:hypothetical protein